MYALFVDLDGVLADFDGGVRAVTGRLPADQPIGSMWARLARAVGFYEHLDWMPDGRRLWEAVRPLEPVILTGLPRGAWAEPQKRAWCRRELGAGVEVITCMSRDKARVAREITSPGVVPVLVDDRESQREAWESMGGVFVHHRDAGTTIDALYRIPLPVLRD